MGSVCFLCHTGKSVRGQVLPFGHSHPCLAAEILKAPGVRLAFSTACGAMAMWKVFLPSVR